jgi:hypothetical protein
MAGGVTCSGKAFVSQCTPEAPIGVTFRQKALRYQRTAQSVLNRAVERRRRARRRSLNGTLWNVASTPLCLDVGGPDHLGPFLGFVGD